jgi:hypothetical protein
MKTGCTKVSFHIETLDLQQVDAIAREQHRTRANMLRYIVLEYLSRCIAGESTS